MKTHYSRLSMKIFKQSLEKYNKNMMTIKEALTNTKLKR